MAFPDGWGRKHAIVIDNTKVSGGGSHSDFIYFVTLDDIHAEVVNAGSNSALNGGGDIRFSSDSAGTTQLACHVINFVTNATAGSRRCLIAVNLPSLSTSSDTTFYVWYNKTGETQPAVGDAFGRNAVYANCIGAYHLGGSSKVDLTGNGKTLTAATGTTANVAGLFDGNAAQFANDGLQSGTSAYNTENVYSVELLWQSDGTAWDQYGYVFNIGGFDTSDGGVTLVRDGDADDNSIRFESYVVGASNSAIYGFAAAPATNVWKTSHITTDRTSPRTRFYVDGSPVAAENTSHVRGNSSARLMLGEGVAYGDQADITMEFCLIYDNYLSADFVTTRHEMMLNHSSFAAAGTPEDVAADINLVIASGTHSHTANNLTLVLGGALAIQSATSAQTADNLTLVQQHTLTINDAVSAHTADTVALSGGFANFGWKSQKITIQASKVAKSFTGSALPVPIRLSHLKTEIVDGGSNSALNGGGDLRISSDAAGENQLPLDVVEFVTNATEGNRRCHLWTLPETVSGSVDTDLYIWYNKAGESQPEAGDPFGRNAVWANEELVLVLENQGSTVVDRTGNHTVTKNGTFGSAEATGLPFNGSSNWLSIPDTGSLDFSSGYALRFLIDNCPTDTDYDQLISKPLSGAWGAPYLAYGITIYPNTGGDDRNGVAVAWGTSSGSYIDPTESEIGRQDIRDGAQHYLAGVYSDANNQNRMYVDGTLEQTVTDSGALDATTTDLLIGRNTLGGSFFEWFEGDIAVAWVRENLVDTEQALTEYNMLSAPETFMIGDLTTELVIQSALSGHTSENLTLTQGQVLIINDGLHSHAADDLTLTQTHILVIDVAGHDHSADNLSLTSVHNLEIASSAHGHSADSLELVSAGELAIGSALHGHAADNVTLSQIHTLPVNSAAHSLTSDNLDLTTNVVLDIEAATHSHVCDNIGLSVNYLLEIDACSHALASENMVLGQGHVVAIMDTVHGLISDNLSINQVHVLSVDYANHALASDNIDLLQNHIIQPNPCSHAHNADEVILVTGIGLDVNSGLSGHSADNISLFQNHVLSPTSGIINLSSDTLTLSVNSYLEIQNISHNLNSDQVDFLQNHFLSINPCQHGHSADTITVVTAPDCVLAIDGPIGDDVLALPSAIIGDLVAQAIITDSLALSAIMSETLLLESDLC